MNNQPSNTNATQLQSTTKGNIMNTILTTKQITTVVMNLAAELTRGEHCAPKDSLAYATAFGEVLPTLLTDGEGWYHKYAGVLDSTTIQVTERVLGSNGEVELRVIGTQEGVVAVDILDILRTLKYITVITSDDCLTQTFCTGSKLIDMLLLDKGSIAPVLASEGINKEVADGTTITNRLRGYGTTKFSEVNKKTINALEVSEFQQSEWTLNMLRIAYKRATPTQRKRMDSQMFVLVGTGLMIPGEAYVTEFAFDPRGRMNQVNCFGPNGGSSDEARGCMDLAGVGSYNTASALLVLTEEIQDMCKANSREELNALIDEANSDSANFYLKYMKIKGEKTSIVSKPVNFAKVAHLIKELRLNHKPYIGIAVGLDAKCSGPQLGGCMIADEGMLVACGFTTKKVDDAYERAIKFCEVNHIKGMTRSGIKKAFMAIFYGAGEDAMLSLDTIEEECFSILYKSSMSTKEVAEVAKAFHRSIVLSFGRELNALRKKIANAGYDYDNDEYKYNKDVKYTMPDGFTVDTRERVRVNGVGREYTTDALNPDITILTNGNVRKYEKPTFKMNDIAYGEFARKGFVNMIQATDAQLARLIILHLQKLGAKHIISIHDCFRVNINEVHLLKLAIQEAYLELFGSVKNEPTEHFAEGSDILGSYFKGSEEATKYEYRGSVQPTSQFYGNGRRVLMNVGGVKFTTLVRKLGQTKYFAK